MAIKKNPFEKIRRQEQLIQKSGDTGLRYPLTLLTGKKENRAVKFTAKSYSKEKIDDKELRREVVSIFLPMPLNVTEANTHNYSQYDGGVLDNLASRVQSGSKSVATETATEVALRALSSSIGEKGGQLGNLKIMGQNALGGIVLNPRSSLFYANPILKIFNFSYTFVPVSRQEADEVLKIINAFRYYSAPGVIDSGNVFLHPEYWDIAFVPEDTYLIKYNSCVLTNVVVTYGDTGPLTLHKDGSPVEIKIELEFREIEVDTKESINEKYNITKPVVFGTSEGE